MADGYLHLEFLLIFIGLLAVLFSGLVAKLKRSDKTFVSKTVWGEKGHESKRATRYGGLIVLLIGIYLAVYGYPV